jgi:signal transduction histidine kinase
MHDTILNTLTALACPGGSTAAVSQCRRDIALLQHALSDSGITSARGRPDPGPVAAVGAVVAEMRARRLAVGLEADGDAVARGSPEPGLVPAPVAAALAHATREALANVAEHAGTGQAWVTVSMTAPGGPDTVPRIRVTIRDAGAGFDPGLVGPARLGVRRSITERVEDWARGGAGRGHPLGLRGARSGSGRWGCPAWPRVPMPW